MTRRPAILLALALAASPAVASSAAAAPKAKPRLAVAKLAGTPAGTVEAGAELELRAAIRNRGGRAARTALKLIAPRRPGAVTGKRLARVGAGRIRAKGKRRVRIETRVPRSLVPRAGELQARHELAACVRRRGGDSRWHCREAARPLVVAFPAPPAPFLPGALTAGDPLFPQIGNGGYDARSYELDLRYTPSNNRLRPGTKATMMAVATQDLGRFGLDFQRLDVSRVTVNGEPARWELRDATPRLRNATQPVKLVVLPAAGIPADETFAVTVHYSGRPVAITDPDGSREGWVRACVVVETPLSCDGAVVVNQPVGAAGWFPGNNVPADKASYRTTITAPGTHKALGIGELASREPAGNGDVRWSWVEDDPTSSYLTTATVGRFALAQGMLTEAATGRTVPTYTAIDSAATPPQRSALESSFARIGPMIDFLGGLYGPYPFDSAGAIADNVPALGYALEVQTKPIFASLTRDDPTMLHEQAHGWFGNSVSPATWLEIWFNEGWAEWSTWFWDAELNGAAESPDDIADAAYEGTGAADWSIPPATLGGDPANLFDRFATYVRSPAMLEYLRQIIGDDRFFALAREIAAEHAYGTITTARFIERAEAASGFTGARLALLGDFFQQWLYEDDKPTILPASF